MSEPGAEGKSPEAQFREYGGGGDQIGARRTRRAFRATVVAVLLLTASLWLAERFLRYPQAEYLYLNGLTLEPQSARVWLRNAVLVDSKHRQTPTPKYVAALAEREEADQVLTTYARACKLDPENANLAIRYGCRLFHEQKAADARVQFAQAAKAAPRNALPMYLEAAVLPWVGNGGEENATPNLSESLALVAKASAGGKPVSFPPVLWHADLPPYGRAYAQLRREIIDECCGPLYAYSQFVVTQAAREIDEGRVQYWDSWLAAVEEMGVEVARSAFTSQEPAGPPVPGVVLQAMCGATIQLDALAQRARLAQAREPGASDEIGQRRAALDQAMDGLRGFENARDARIEASRAAYMRPWQLVGRGLGLALCAWLLLLLACKLFSAGGAARAIPHDPASKAMFISGGVLTVLVLAGASLLAQRDEAPGPWLGGIWSVVMLAWLISSTLHAFTRLPKTRHATISNDERTAAASLDIPAVSDGAADVQAARRCRRRAGLVLAKRCAGVAIGVLLCATCAWIIGHRIVVGVYPWQLEILTTGLAAEEQIVVQQVMANL